MDEDIKGLAVMLTAVVALLQAKGVFTAEELDEYMKRANEELDKKMNQQ